MPTTRQAFVPQPIVDRSPEQLRAYIEGVDPVSGRSFAQDLIEGLSQPLNDEDLKGLTFERSTPRLIEPDSEDSLHQLFEDNLWTDHLPIVLPTEARVERMLAGTSHAADKVVGKLRPTLFREYWEFTVEKVAVNAVMAGARPEYLPVILALLASGQTARSSSTNSSARAWWLGDTSTFSTTRVPSSLATVIPSPRVVNDESPSTPGRWPST